MSKKSELPNGYKRCEYLESTGTQWIDSGIFLYENKQILIKFEICQTANNKHVIGVDANLNIYIKPSIKYWRLNGVPTPIEIDVNVFHKIVLENTQNGRKGIIDDNYNVLGSVANKAYYFPLFAYYDSGIFCSKIKLKYLIIQESDNIVRNFIPALDPTGRPCMYDTVTKQPFYNQGSGEFLYKIA